MNRGSWHDAGTARRAAGERIDVSAGTESAGPVVALCRGHRCAALAKSGDAGLAAAVARSRGGILLSAPRLQRCADGAVGAVAIRAPSARVTGPSVWLGGLDAPGHLQALGRWVEQWHPAAADASTLPEDLASTVIGSGPPIGLAPARP